MCNFTRLHNSAGLFLKYASIYFTYKLTKICIAVLRYENLTFKEILADESV